MMNLTKCFVILIVFAFTSGHGIKTLLYSLPDGAKEGSFSVKGNHPFIISLKGNPTTGYQWELLEYDKMAMTLVQSQYYPDQSKRGMVGVGGRFSFVFKAGNIKAQNNKVTFVHKRSWEKTTKGDNVNIFVRIY